MSEGHTEESVENNQLSDNKKSHVEVKKNYKAIMKEEIIMT